MEIIRVGVERFNDLDGEDQFIDTIEREDIADLFTDMAEASGLTSVDDVTDEWRDW